MQLITAPSKTQEFNGRNFSLYTQPLCLSTSLIVNNHLQSMAHDEIAALMKTSPQLTESTCQKIKNFVTPFSPDNAKQALFTFQGDAYDAIAADTYTKGQLSYAQEHLNILSGLYGLLRPLDLMQPYRLEMGARLAVEENKNLYQLWKKEVTRILNDRLSESTEATVINLASKEYSKVIDRKQLKGRIIEIVFQQEHGGKLKTIPIYSKRARGLMIHYAISKTIEKANKLQQFNLDGYTLNSSVSSDEKWVFTKQK